MSQTIWADKKILLLSFAAAGATVIAGILHVMMAPRSFSEDLGQGILFLVGGIAQIFWAVPVIRRWGKIWQIIGLVGTVVFVILFFASRYHLIPENVFGAPQGNFHPGELPRGNFTGGELPRDHAPRNMGFRLPGDSLPIEVCQIAFIGLYAVLGKMYSKKPAKNPDKN